MKRLTLILTIKLCLTIGLLFVFRYTSPARAAQPQCASPYVVQWGDNLFRIALRAGTTPWELARLNGISNVDLIYAGQVLCMPSSLVERKSSVDLIVEYTFDREADSDAPKWTLGRNGRAGKRASYPIFSGDMIDTYSTTIELRSASVNTVPLMWLVRASPNTTTYTLVVFGDPRPLLDLQMEITPTQKITDIIPPDNLDLINAGLCSDTKQPVSRLSLSGKNAVRLRAELINKDGNSIPIDIDTIDFHQAVAYAVPCYRDVGFALHPMPDPAMQGYRLGMVLTDGGVIGPPGRQWRLRCAGWAGGGWWSRWRWAWFGC
jgi:LysM repeat protein